MLGGKINLKYFDEFGGGFVGEVAARMREESATACVWRRKREGVAGGCKVLLSRWLVFFADFLAELPGIIWNKLRSRFDIVHSRFELFIVDSNCSILFRLKMTVSF